ncbi:MAG: endopeptidase La [Gemmatimonadetes bacterium]|nr:endopeptidase La [Gemmatimonadota bacterium]NNM05655.1 endopeptidase La [Gemmatimonadota bacterium]
MATLHRIDGQVEIPEQLPVVALRDLVFFPYMVLPLLIGRSASVVALEEAEKGDGLLLLVAQKDADVEDPVANDLHLLGTVIRVIQTTRLPDGTARVVMEGLGRARIEEFVPSNTGFRARVALAPGAEREDPDAVTAELEALARKVRRLFDDYIEANERLPRELSGTVAAVQDRVRLAHLVSGHLLLSAMEKQELLEALQLGNQLEILRQILVRELEIFRIEEKLDEQIQHQMDSGRRQLYLQEQLKAITKELGSTEGEMGELEAFLRQTPLPPEAKERAERELDRLKHLSPVAPEAAVIRTYLDWILGLPWMRKSEDNLDVGHASEILEEAHYGLTEVKDRVLDHIAVLSLVGDLQGPILCLVGPPGVGKTSLGKSIATALGREFVRASLGGVRDEAEIRGHRRTYVGALPGRVVQGMRRSGTRNPIFLLDEVDKLARDFHGDPGAALLEVLDPEQNRTFTDHYLELEFDLSDVLFIATANTLAGIPEPLRDRMEVIRIPGYLTTEKKTIARRFIWPKQAKKHGLGLNTDGISDEGLDLIIGEYTREAGVRELERRISGVARKLARSVAEGDRSVESLRTVNREEVKELLGPPPYTPEPREEGMGRAGIANGLAWTAAGGEILDVEVAVVPGSGKIQLTGTLGEVMKESAFAAVTYARSRANLFGLSPNFHEEVDIHIHIPEGATPKDGPSAGITIAVALISALTDVPTRSDVAMTGEITLRGRVLGVGGVKEKAVAAFQGKIKRVLLPNTNAGDLERIPDEVKDGVEFLLVRTMDEVLEGALLTMPFGRGEAATNEFLDGTQGPGVQLSQ